MLAWMRALCKKDPSDYCGRISGRQGLEVGRYQFRVHVVHETFPAQFTILCSALILCHQVNGNVIGKVATHFIRSELHEYECD